MTVSEGDRASGAKRGSDVGNALPVLVIGRELGQLELGAIRNQAAAPVERSPVGGSVEVDASRPRADPVPAGRFVSAVHRPTGVDVKLGRGADANALADADPRQEVPASVAAAPVPLHFADRGQRGCQANAAASAHAVELIVQYAVARIL